MLNQCERKQGFVGHKIAGSKSVMFIFQKPGWHINLGFSEEISADTPLKELQSRLKHVALDQLPTPGLAVSGWEIRPQTPVSSFKDGVEIVGFSDGEFRGRNT